MICEVSGSLFGGQNRYKMGSNCILAAEGLFKASWSALEDLLEPKRVVKRAPKKGEGDQRELNESSRKLRESSRRDQAAARGGVGEGFTPLL